MFEHIRIVLVATSHPGNIGASARAMKNMGLNHLYLVSPLEFPHQEATSRASGADDILDNAVVVETLADAINPCQLVFGTSARSRKLPWPLISPRECAEKTQIEKDKSIAIVFGRERTGLTNEELAMCHYHVHIPTVESFSSLNLAAAVQVLVYELRVAGLAGIEQTETTEFIDELATSEQINGLVDHFRQTMSDVEFLDPNHPKLLMQRIQRLFMRTPLENTEVNILRGFLSAIQKKI